VLRESDLDPLTPAQMLRMVIEELLSSHQPSAAERLKSSFTTFPVPEACGESSVLFRRGFRVQARLTDAAVEMLAPIGVTGVHLSAARTGGKAAGLNRGLVRGGMRVRNSE
jgi:hypothetical protein